jgi:hypothetical protein
MGMRVFKNEDIATKKNNDKYRNKNIERGQKR